MKANRLTWEERNAVLDSLNKITPKEIDSHWIRYAENDSYAYDYNKYTADSRLIDKKDNSEVWSYYTDFYNGYN